MKYLLRISSKYKSDGEELHLAVVVGSGGTWFKDKYLLSSVNNICHDELNLMDSDQPMGTVQIRFQKASLYFRQNTQCITGLGLEAVSRPYYEV